jgi:uncharacterized protein (DUF1501 family)
MLTRRQLLAQTGLGAGALALTDLMSREGLAAEQNPLASKSQHFPAKAKNIIWLFMHGGPSQVDTFDPKPALAEYDGKSPPAELHELHLQFTDVSKQKLMASRHKFQQFGEAGIPMNEGFKRLSKCADDLAVVRGMHHEVFNHTPGIFLSNTGDMRMGRPSLGSWLTYGLGCETDNLPAYVVMNDGPLKPGAGVWGNGFLPVVYQGTNINSGATPISNLRPQEKLSGIDQRKTLDFAQWLNERHKSTRPGDSNLDARIASYELAFRMQSAAPEAVDINRESKTTRELYGGGFGEHCLVARRLVERGVRMVQIYHGCGGGGWDTHGDNHNRHTKLIQSIDQGCAALLTDLKARGLLDETLVIWGGEFGRTPSTEGKDGRDHSPYGFSIWMAGGGVKGGQIIGATDDFGFRAVDDKVHLHDFHATVLKLLGLDPEQLTYRFGGLDQRLIGVEKRRDIYDRLT